MTIHLPWRFFQSASPGHPFGCRGLYDRCSHWNFAAQQRSWTVSKLLKAGTLGKTHCCLTGARFFDHMMIATRWIMVLFLMVSIGLHTVVFVMVTVAAVGSVFADVFLWRP